MREALALATEEELDALVDVLFRPRFNPLDYVQTPAPEEVRRWAYDRQLQAIEDRICFLAADGLTTLRGDAQQLPYRTILSQTCRHLKIPYTDAFTTDDLEAEIFLHLLQNTLKRLPEGERSRLTQTIHTSLQTAPEGGDLKHLLHNDSLRLALEGGSALALSALVRPLVLRHIAHQVMLYAAKQQLAQEALKQGGRAAAQIQSYFAAQLARRGLAVNAARYAATRSVLGLVGPALWVWFLADLGWRAIATNHSRTIPALFLLAQIRLTRVEPPASAF